MSFQQFPFNLPTASLPLIDIKSGQPTNFFWQYLLSLFSRTGGGNGIVPIVNPKNPLTAAGTTQGTALGLTADWNDVETVTATNNGVIMPALKPGNDIWVFNGNATSMNVYPFSGAAIDQLAVNAPFVLAQNKLRCFQCWSPTQLRSYGN